MKDLTVADLKAMLVLTDPGPSGDRHLTTRMQWFVRKPGKTPTTFDHIEGPFGVYITVGTHADMDEVRREFRPILADLADCYVLSNRHEYESQTR